MKGAVEITLKRDTEKAPRGWHCDRDDYINDGDTAVVSIGDLVVVETVYSDSDKVTKSWLRDVNTLGRGRGRRLRSPFVAGLVALRGSCPEYRWNSSRERHPHHPRHPDNPIRCVVLCLGGSHALVYNPEVWGKEGDGSGSRLMFHMNKMQQLRNFLGDPRIDVACFGAKETAGKLAEEWGLHVARPVDLEDVVARSYGQEAVVEIGRKRVKRKMNLKGLDLEGMALVALGPEMRLARWPADVANADWGLPFRDIGDDEWMYATRDAYLCFEICLKCFQKLGAQVA